VLIAWAILSRLAPGSRPIGNFGKFMVILEAVGAVPEAMGKRSMLGSFRSTSRPLLQVRAGFDRNTSKQLFRQAYHIYRPVRLMVEEDAVERDGDTRERERASQPRP
jgi:hypothetical protein